MDFYIAYSTTDSVHYKLSKPHTIKEHAILESENYRKELCELDAGSKSGVLTLKISLKKYAAFLKLSPHKGVIPEWMFLLLESNQKQILNLVKPRVLIGFDLDKTLYSDSALNFKAKPILKPEFLRAFLKKLFKFAEENDVELFLAIVTSKSDIDPIVESGIIIFKEFLRLYNKQGLGGSIIEQNAYYYVQKQQVRFRRFDSTVSKKCEASFSWISPVQIVPLYEKHNALKEMCSVLKIEHSHVLFIDDDDKNLEPMRTLGMNVISSYTVCNHSNRLPKTTEEEQASSEELFTQIDITIKSMIQKAALPFKNSPLSAILDLGLFNKKEEEEEEPPLSHEASLEL